MTTAKTVSTFLNGVIVGMITIIILHEVLK